MAKGSKCNGAPPTWGCGVSQWSGADGVVDQGTAVKADPFFLGSISSKLWNQSLVPLHHFHAPLQGPGLKWMRIKFKGLPKASVIKISNILTPFKKINTKKNDEQYTELLGKKISWAMLEPEAKGKN